MPDGHELIIEPAQLLRGSSALLFDCRFSLADSAAGRAEYEAGHIPGAHYLHLEEDLSAPVGQHGGRHPLPDAASLVATLARFGVDRDTEVVAYDASRFAFAARLWWLMRSLGYRPPRLLNGGLSAFVAAGGQLETTVPEARPCAVPEPGTYRTVCDIDGLRQAQSAGAVLVDSREAARYQGIEEPIDPVAGHIPGALNHPWQGVSTADGCLLDLDAQRAHWGDTLAADELVVYCGSGVTACVNLFSLALLGRGDATLYAGSWSDWCSWL
ncbi:MAG: sulfurtransferase [Halioglobus sp.]